MHIFKKVINWLSVWPNDILTGTLGSYIGTLCWVISCLLVHKVLLELSNFRKSFRKRKIKKILGYRKGSNVYIVIGTNIHSSHTKRSYTNICTPIIGLLFELVNELKSIYNNKIDIHIVFDHDNHEKYFYENSILIGGPGINSMISRIAHSDELWFCSTKSEKIDIKSDRFFFDSKDNKYYIKHNKDEVTDYGLFAKIPNSRSPQNPLIILFGIETFGTCASLSSFLIFDNIIKLSHKGFIRSQKLNKSTHIELLTELSGIRQTYSEELNIIDIAWRNSEGHIKSVVQKPFHVPLKKCSINKELKRD